MIKVACPSCQAPYELDERRLPPGGLKMRCPKCGSSFRVGPEGVADGPASPAAAPPAAAPAPKKKPIAPPLPAVPSPDVPAPAEGTDADLPAVKPPRRPDLPAPGGGRRPLTTPFDDLEDADLPAVVKGAPASARGSAQAAPTDVDDLDLPMPKGGGPVPSDADLSTPEGDGGLDGLDLPMPKGGGPVPSEADLPTPEGDGGLDGLDLPMPRRAPTGPVDADVPDLPAPKGASTDLDELDLPMPRQASRGPVGADAPDLPAPKGASTDLDALDLPVPAAGAGPPGDEDLPVAVGEEALPVPVQDRVDLPVRQGQADLPAATPGPSGDGGDALPGLDLPDLDADDDVPPLPEPRVPAGVEDAQAPPAEQGTEDALGLEFDALPEEPAAAGSAASPAWTPAAERSEGAFPEPAGAQDAPQARDPRARALRAAALAAVSMLVVLGAGFALGLTPHGSFGIYFFERFLPSAGDPAQVRAAIAKAEEVAGTDTLDDARRGLRILAEARREAGLNRELLAHSLLAESLFEIRFGPAADAASRAAAIHARLRKRSFDAPGAAAARAGHALAQGRVDEAHRHMGAAVARGGSSALLAGELALARGHADQAAAAFREASDVGARATWGLARALAVGGDLEEAASAARATLEASPRHAGARALLARHAWAQGEPDAAQRWAREAAGKASVDGRRLRASARTRAAAWGLLGDMHAQAGRPGHARAAYEGALQADSDAPEALVGLGRVLVQGGQAQEALARFETAEGALRQGGALPPGSDRRALALGARIGGVRALLAQDRMAEAQNRITALAEDHPQDADVLLWLGKTAEAAGSPAQAETHYRALMEHHPAIFDGYLALAQLHFAEGKPNDAAAVLERARERVPETAEVRRLVGESELARGRLDEAIEAFEGALALDAEDGAARFGLGVAFRRAGRLDRAKETFAALADGDPDYPGLALERGRIYETEGQAEDAVAAYRAALERRPDDLDVKLRLASALVAVGSYDEADPLLEEITRERTRSPEAVHLQGRVALARGALREAQVQLERAVQLDASQGVFHMVLARAYLEQGSLAQAFDAVEEALDRDPELGDAHWIRGRLRLRTGAVRDAQRDLRRALELAPHRHEAHADMGESLDQLGQRREAMAAYERALEGDAKRGQWWYRLARLQLDAGRKGPAAASLGRATELGDAAEAPPGWLADAHRLRAETLQARGRGKDAVVHYERFLDLAPPDALDRKTAQAALDRLRGR